ncbi:MAG: zinc ribbon domain-containing protein [Chloroflexi bacterium]|nr:zinc ribbon domain-containing protein [Chloroflexota bacterium]
MEVTAKMPYCINCSSRVTEQDMFCSKCGTAVKTQVSPQPSKSHSNQPIKPLTNLTTGAMIGAGVALLCVGLFITFSLNALYGQQISYLTDKGIQVNIYTSGLDNMIFLISSGALIAIMGAYALLIGSLNYFNDKVRVAMERKDARARAGNGLISGGFIATALFSADLIQQLYHQYRSSWYEPVLFLFIIGGLAAILIGALFIRSSYLRSLSPTKV